MDTQLLQQDIAPLLGIDDMPTEDRDAFMENIGSLILESVCMRLVASMSEEEAIELSKTFETTQDPEAFIQALEKKYPEINTIFTEEVAAFKEEAIAVMS